MNFATFKEEIVQLSVGGDDVAKAWFVGKPLRVFYDYEKVGIWQTSEKDEAAKYGKTPGEIKVRDQNGDGKITASDDRVVLDKLPQNGQVVLLTISLMEICPCRCWYMHVLDKLLPVIIWDTTIQEVQLPW